MLRYQSWLETRWRFLIGSARLVCSAAACVFTYPKVVELLTMMPVGDLSGERGRPDQRGAGRGPFVSRGRSRGACFRRTAPKCLRSTVAMSAPRRSAIAITTASTSPMSSES